jgi:hypothetical protein
MSDYMCRYKKKRLNSIPGRHIAMSAWLYYSQADLSASRPAYRAAWPAFRSAGPELQRPGQVQQPSRHIYALGRRSPPRPILGRHPSGPSAGIPAAWPVRHPPPWPASLLAGLWAGAANACSLRSTGEAGRLGTRSPRSPSATLAQLALGSAPLIDPEGIDPSVCSHRV